MLTKAQNALLKGNQKKKRKEIRNKDEKRQNEMRTEW